MKRGLKLEQLESRNLLAADVEIFHNFLQPEDTNGDGSVTPIDALLGLNALSGASDAEGNLLDVNANGILEPIDSLITINMLGRAEGEASSNVPASSRIASIREAIADSKLPTQFGLERAEEILETLVNGGRPELGEVITEQSMSELRAALAEGETPIADAVFNSLGIESADDIVDQVEVTLQEFGIDITNVSNAVQNLVDTLPDNSSQLGDRIVEILNNLGDDGQNLGDQLSDLINSEDVAAIGDQVETILADAGVDTDNIAQRVRDFASSIADDGLSLREAVLQAIDKNNADGTLRDGIVDLLQSEELSTVRNDLQTQLSQLDVDLTGVQSAIDNLSARLAAGETPVRDWIAGLVTLDQPVGVAAQLFAESETLGEGIDNLIDNIADDVAGLSDSIGDFVNDLTGGDSSVGQLVDNILNNLSEGNSIATLVDNVLRDVDGLLENLFANNGFLDNLLDDLLS